MVLMNTPFWLDLTIGVFGVGLFAITGVFDIQDGPGIALVMIGFITLFAGFIVSRRIRYFIGNLFLGSDHYVYPSDDKKSADSKKSK